ncbi:MAG: hypothetical protein AVDCRST_MAG87-3228, partial [uncultured Thermomicrobiales bacterium]
DVFSGLGSPDRQSPFEKEGKQGRPVPSSSGHHGSRMLRCRECGAGTSGFTM